MALLYNLYQRPWLLLSLILFFVAWELVWKGIALWYSAQHKQKSWFVVLLILNTLGILPIIYLLVFRPKEEKKRTSQESKPVESKAKKPKKKP